MERQSVTEKEVKGANRRFYDEVAERYEELDGRRSPALEDWLRAKLRDLSRMAPEGRLLDLGTGSGLVTRCASGLFSFRVGLDLSPKILAASGKDFEGGVAADVDRLPFPDQSFDLMTCFAVLHHLYAFEQLVSEAARVIKPGGVFYADHDLDSAFSRRFRWPLLFYRRWHRAGGKYLRACPNLPPRLYEWTEWQQGGVDARKLADSMAGAGFRVEVRFHWYGLSPRFNRLFGTGERKRGWAPLFSLVAVKGGPALKEPRRNRLRDDERNR